jgi:hypothetical protein
MLDNLATTYSEYTKKDQTTTTHKNAKKTQLRIALEYVSPLIAE